MNSTPFCDARDISSAVIGRLALQISISPTQKRFIPPPVPFTPTVGVTVSCIAYWNSSATASVTGYKLLDPSMRMLEPGGMLSGSTDTVYFDRPRLRPGPHPVANQIIPEHKQRFTATAKSRLGLEEANCISY